jgi:hypothetical protein
MTPETMPLPGCSAPCDSARRLSLSIGFMSSPAGCGAIIAGAAPLSTAQAGDS